mgnify:CR=1 FL=1
MKIITLIFFFLINLSNFSSAQEKIVFLNVNYIYNNSISGKKASDTIQTKIKTLENDVKKFSKSINSNKEKLSKQKNILSKNDFKKKFNDIEIKIIEFNKKIKIRNDEIVKLKKNVRSKFVEELRKILSEYSSNNSIQLIIEQENVLIGSNKLNITNDILKIVDSRKIKLIN